MGAPSARVSELSRHWVQAGHQVKVLTGFPNHPTGKLDPEYRKKFKRMIYVEQDKGVKVVRTWLLPVPNRKSIERILNYFSFCLSACITGMFLSKTDVIIGTSPQLLVGIVGWWLGKVKNVPFIFEVRDLWPDSIVASDVGSDETLLIRILRTISGFLYRKSDHIVVVTPAFKDDLVDNWEIEAEKISIVHNGVEVDLFHPTRYPVELSSTLGLDGKFVVSYIGTHGFAHGLDLILYTAIMLKDTFPKLLFLLVGEGAEKEHLVKMADQYGLNNVLFIESQPRERIPFFINVSDICLVLLKRRDIFKTVIPTKMLEFFACGKPIILGVDGQARKVLESAKAGIIITPENPMELARSVMYLYENPELRLEYGNNGRQFIEENFSRKITAEQYTHVFNSVLAKFVEN